MSKYIIALFSNLLISQMSLSQYCMTSGPTSNIDSNIESLFIIGEASSINYTGCPASLGVEEFLSQTANLNAGNNYSVNIQFGTCGDNYPGVGEAWIDFNIDGIFDPSESIGTWSGNPPTAISTFNFLVPSTSASGQSRMRVIQFEGGTLPIDPCEPFTWGSTTDFNILISNGVDCSGYIGDNITSPREVNTLPFSESHSSSVCYSNVNPTYNSPDVYYLITNLNNVNVLEISLCGSNFDTFMSLLDSNGEAIAINDDHVDCGTQSKITHSTLGHDSLFVVVEGWGIESGDYTININETSANIQSLNKEVFSVYPNPTDGTFSIQGDYSGVIELTNYNGKILLSTYYSPNQQLDLSNFTTGIYFLRLVNSPSSPIQKVIYAQ
tara:strand:- start:4636 stop:5781 length:1146 start_codon:yes stop_codon:yes gene_type:complete